MTCSTCKYFQQGMFNHFCCNPKQTSVGLTKYCHRQFTCRLHDEGTLTERQMNNKGFTKQKGSWKKADGTVVEIEYYTK